MRTRLPLSLVPAALLALVAFGGVTGPARAADEAADAAGETVFIQMRIWQQVDDAENLWISARPRGGRWDTLGTIPFPLEQRAGGYSDVSKFRYADLAMAGVGLRVWQPEIERERVFVQACSDSCPGRVPGMRLLWRPLGMNPLALDDGHSTSGRYRYGNLTVAVPRSNPGLLADRQHLLALRDVLEGSETELDWSVGTPTSEWQGVTVGGTPSRVMGLDLRGHGLAGEIWGYLGDLTALTALRLDGNALTGSIPSKLALLKQLTTVRLDGNEFEGCVAPSLRAVPDNDLDSLGLLDCHAPVFAGSSSGWVVEPDLAGGSYRIQAGHAGVVVFDVPVHGRTQLDIPTSGYICDYDEPLASIWEALACSEVQGFVLGEADGYAWDDFDVWIVVDWRHPSGTELERSHYSGCVYDCGPEGSPASLVEQLMASVWVNPAIGEDEGWVWP